MSIFALIMHSTLMTPHNKIKMLPIQSSDLALQGQRKEGEPELLSLQHWHYGYIGWHHLRVQYSRRWVRLWWLGELSGGVVDRLQ